LGFGFFQIQPQRHLRHRQLLVDQGQKSINKNCVIQATMIQSISLLVVVLVTLSRTHYETGGIKICKEKKRVFVAIDLHKRRWHVTVRDADVACTPSNGFGRPENLGW
jgi:hypothetical protein